MESSMPKMRQQVARQLNLWLQMRPVPPEKGKKYTDKIISGKHDDWVFQLAESFRSQSQDLFASSDDAEGSSSDEIQLPDTATLLLAEDVKELTETNALRKGNARISKDAKDVAARLGTDRKQANMTNEKIEFVAAIQPYSPCMVPLNDLKKIKLADLTEETHHRGSALVVKRHGAILPGRVTTVGAVEDEEGEVEDIELHLASAYSGEHFLSQGQCFAIKEPYFTIRRDNVTTIRVDHPSDIVAVKSNDPRDHKSATEWKDTGNSFFSSKEHRKARESYLAALSAADKTEQPLKMVTLRNLARVDLELGRYDEACEKALASVSDANDSTVARSHVTAYYRAARASYLLGDFEKAAKLFRELLKMDSNDADGKRELERVEARMAERDLGQYNFEKLTTISLRDPRLDAATYASRVRVDRSAIGGRGLVAAQAFEIGDLVLCEKAYCTTFASDKDSFLAWKLHNGKLSTASSVSSFWKQIVLKLSNNPSTLEKATTLEGDYAGIGTEHIIADNMTVVDAFQIHSAIERNTFGIPTPVKGQRNKPFGYTAENVSKKPLGDNVGLFSIAAMTNHSCVPNTRKIFVGDLLLLRATRTISKGEEILHAYVQTDAGVQARRQLLESTWHFLCSCKMCLAQEKESRERSKHRDMLSKRVDELAKAISSGSAGEPELAEAEALIKRVKGLYEQDIYKSLPRTAPLPLQVALAQHRLRRGQSAKCIAVLTELFDMLGWSFSLNNSKVTLSRKEGCETDLVPDVVETLVGLGATQRKSGKSSQADQVENLARKLYLSLNGVPNGWDQLLKSKS
ncbi:hypothetical protein LTR37_019572 [Vermiconidia calcicola]|uniref:Uncharacterized protein n=1 Tax=Vermiconidia calcicola TaxID=1690605 RepID=A0ACC3MDR0_9PEZI|nr:hypothetical protein LTR37_019572 [Vermiconidia calcicola]